MSISFMPKKALLGAILAAGCVSAFATGQVADATATAETGLSLDDLFNLQVVTASKKAESRDDAPNVMYVVTADEIRRRGYRTLEDVMNNVPGFKIGNTGTIHSQIRGIAPNENSGITVMLNGHNINPMPEPFIWNTLTLDNVERIEFIVGPGSVLYGSETLNAIVNMIMKKAVKNQVSLAGGTDKYITPSGLFGKVIDDTKHLTIAGDYRHWNGWDAFDTLNYGGLVDNDVSGSVRFHNFMYAQGSIDGWTAQISSYMDKFNYAGTNWNDPKLKDALQMQRVDSYLMQNEHKWNDILSTFTEVAFDNRRYERRITEYDTVVGGNFDLSLYTFSGDISGRLTLPKTYIQFGFQPKYKVNDENYSFGWDPQGTREGTIQNMVKLGTYNVLGGYASAEYTPIDMLKITAAVRGDKDEVLGTDADFYWAPRLALMVKPLEKWTSKVSYNTAIGMPAVWQGPLNNLWGADNPQSPDWAAEYPVAKRPQVMKAVEFQNVLYYIPRTRLSLTYYYQQMKDYITWVGPFTNAGDFKGQGFEAEFTTKVTDFLNLWGNYSYSATEFKQTSKSVKTGVAGTTGSILTNDDDEALGVPKHIANYGVDWKLSEMIHFSTDINYSTKSPAFKQSLKTPTDSSGGSWVYVDNQIFLNATISAENIFDRFDLSFSVKNITNNQDAYAAQAMNKMGKPRGIACLGKLSYNF